MITTVCPVVVHLAQAMVDPMAPPVSVWRNPKLTAYALICPAVIRVVKSSPSLVLREWCLDSAEDPPDCVVDVKPVKCTS